VPSRATVPLAMKRLDFYSLPRAVQDRLIAAFRGEFDPKPIVSRRTARATAFAWVGLSAASVLLFVALYRLGYGDLDSGLSRHSRPLLAAYVALAAAFALGVVRAVAGRFARRRLPFATGVYLFPANLIDARERTLRVYPLDELTEALASEPGSVQVALGARRFSFQVESARREETVEAIRSASARMREELAEEKRRFLDPLIPPSVASPLASDVPFKPLGARWTRGCWVIAGAVGLLGVPIHLLRDRGSDARMFAVARERDDVATYRRYLARGSAQRDLVARELLPRAALRAAVAQRSVEAIQQFIREYPDTAIQDEVARALRAALEAALAEAKRPGTLAALMAFTERYPNHGLEQPLLQARHAIYQRALERYRVRVPGKNVQVAGFLELLIATCERIGARKTPEGVRGPTVAVRLRRLPSRGFDQADKLVRANPWYRGVPSLPSRYVDATHVEGPEKQVAAALVEAFSRELDAEIVTFAAGAPLEGQDDKLPAFAEPTLVVGYRLEPSGSSYANRKPRSVIIGLSMVMDSVFTLPGIDKPLKLRHTAAVRVPLPRILEHKDPSPPGAVESDIYGAMLDELFATAPKRYLAAWFTTPER
jgi:hypothetical protein